MPRLTVHAASRQPSRLDYPPDEFWRHRFVLIVAHGQQGAHSVENFHRLPPCRAAATVGYKTHYITTMIVSKPRFQRVAKKTNKRKEFKSTVLFW
jgi:hypothetical protein